MVFEDEGSTWYVLLCETTKQHFLTVGIFEYGIANLEFDDWTIGLRGMVALVRSPCCVWPLQLETI